MTIYNLSDEHREREYNRNLSNKSSTFMHLGYDIIYKMNECALKNKQNYSVNENLVENSQYLQQTWD